MEEKGRKILPFFQNSFLDVGRLKKSIAIFPKICYIVYVNKRKKRKGD